MSETHQASAVELQSRLQAELSGSAFVVLRDGTGAQRIMLLDGVIGTYSVGREHSASIQLSWDRRVSRVHAELEYVGGGWTIADNGLSRNGTFVNDERVRGRRRLFDGDHLLCGGTRILFRCPVPEAADDAPDIETSTGYDSAPVLSAAQRKVAQVLCRGFGADGTLGEPSSNEAIAAELFISVATVKAHLRVLYQRFELEGMPRNVKRRYLATTLIRAGIVDPD